MRQWRVGSISLGLILILIGITFILGNIYDYSIVGNIIKWWPVILIIFGVEILASGYSSEKNLEKVKFDGVSVFLTLIIFVITGCLFIASNVFKFTKDGMRISDDINSGCKIESKLTQKYDTNPNYKNPAVYF